jgi:hypothetical protein
VVSLPASWTRAVLRPLWIFGFNLALLCVARLLLLLFNRQQFEALSGSEVVLSLLRGLRFDLSLVATFAGLPVLMLLLPFRWSSSRPWQLTWSRLCLVLTCASLMVVVVDLNYFALVHRHLGVEVAASTSEFSSLAALVLQEYPLQLLVLLSLPVGLLLFWPRLERWDDARRGDERPAALVAPLALVLLVLGMRGGFGGKPLNIVNAFESGSLARGYLELNAPFSLYHSLRNSRFRPVEFMEEEAAYALSRDLLVGEGEVLVSPDELPLQRRRAVGTSRPNVVVIVMESWGAHYVDSLRERRGLEPLGATPHFDALAREGLLLERLYCAGQLSIHLRGPAQYPRPGRGARGSAFPAELPLDGARHRAVGALLPGAYRGRGGLPDPLPARREAQLLPPGRDLGPGRVRDVHGDGGPDREHRPGAHGDVGLLGRGPVRRAAPDEPGGTGALPRLLLHRLDPRALPGARGLRRQPLRGTPRWPTRTPAWGASSSRPERRATSRTPSS